MDKPKFVYSLYISTTPEKLWEALTSSAFTQQYWGGHKIESEWTVGAPVKFIKPDGAVDVKGEVLQIEPPQLLSYTFVCRPRGGAGAEESSRVTFEIAVAFGITKLTVTHDGFEPGSLAIEEVSQGWLAILSSLKTLLETGTALAFNWKP